MYYQGANLGYGQNGAMPSAQGAPINTASSAVRPNVLQQYQPSPAPYADKSMTSTFEEMSAAPEWLQTRLQKGVVGPNQAGSLDPALQMRDLYSTYQPRVNQLVSMYGREAIDNPYFMQSEFQGQSQANSFDPFSSQLTDYEVYRGGGRDNLSVKNVTRNPFTGEIENWGSTAFNPHAYYNPLDREYDLQRAEERFAPIADRLGMSSIYDLYGIGANPDAAGRGRGLYQNLYRQGLFRQYYSENPQSRMSGKALIKY
jgi:hypothetical protein